MASIECFFAEPIPRVRIALRRYHSGEEKCPSSGFSYHNASVTIEEKESPLPQPEDRYERLAQEVSHDDPRWPKVCACGYEFKEDDPWQTNNHRLYSGGGKEFILGEAPVGAMWDAWWWDEKGPDGIQLVVKTPAGEWMPDMPSTDGNPWTRTGTLPKVTCRPSILFPSSGYHAFLTDGVLTDC